MRIYDERTDKEVTNGGIVGVAMLGREYFVYLRTGYQVRLAEWELKRILAYKEEEQE